MLCWGEVLRLLLYYIYIYLLINTYIYIIYIALLINIYIVSLCQPKSWQRTGSIITFFELISKDLLSLQDCGGMKSASNYGGSGGGWGGAGSSFYISSEK